MLLIFRGPLYSVRAVRLILQNKRSYPEFIRSLLIGVVAHALAMIATTAAKAFFADNSACSTPTA